MTEAGIKEMLSSTGIPFAYAEWPVGAAPGLPWGVYCFDRSEGFYADDMNYSVGGRWTVELYWKVKDPANERKVDDALKGAGLPYKKYETDADAEGARLSVWQFETIGE